MDVHAGSVINMRPKTHWAVEAYDAMLDKEEG